mgnify:CR=1 FL=1
MKEWSLVGCMLIGKGGKVMTEEEILEEIEGFAKDLGGTYLHQTAINTSGQSMKRIIIEYDNEID